MLCGSETVSVLPEGEPWRAETCSRVTVWTKWWWNMLVC